MSTVTAIACDLCERVTAGGRANELGIWAKRVLAREEGWRRFRLRSTGKCVDLCGACAQTKVEGFEVDEFGAKR